MYLVTFFFDLGDDLALYTGKIVGTYAGGYKVTYYEPTARQFLSIDLPESEVIGKGHTDSNLLPLAPTIMPQIWHGPAPATYRVRTRSGFYGLVTSSTLSTPY